MEKALNHVTFLILTLYNCAIIGTTPPCTMSGPFRHCSEFDIREYNWEHKSLRPIQWLWGELELCGCVWPASRLLGLWQFVSVEEVLLWACGSGLIRKDIDTKAESASWSHVWSALGNWCTLVKVISWLQWTHHVLFFTSGCTLFDHGEAYSIEIIWKD